MDRNHGVLMAIAAGVAIAGTSYAASAVLFRGGNTEPPKAVETVQPTAIASPSSLARLPKEPNPQTIPAPQTKTDTTAPSSSAPELATELTPIYADQQENIALAQAILKELPGYPCVDTDPSDSSAVRYFYTFDDLNQDGMDEAIAYLVGPYTCGTGGCTVLIFDVNGSEDYTLNSRITVARNPIVVTENQTDGWRDLVIPVSGGGAPSGYHMIQWTGSSYASNPSVAPEWTASTLTGTALIADAITADTPAPKLAGDVCLP